MGDVVVWVEWVANDGASAALVALLNDIRACIEREEPGATSFRAYRHADGRTFHLLETFEDASAALAHFSGEIGPVRRYVPRQLELAALVRAEVHGELTTDEAARLRSYVRELTCFAPILGFVR